MVRAAHFPLGALLLHKTGIGNQWAVLQLLARKDGFLYLGSHRDDLQSGKTIRVLPSSGDIRPLGNYSEAFTIVLPKGSEFYHISQSFLFNNASFFQTSVLQLFLFFFIDRNCIVCTATNIEDQHRVHTYMIT